MGREFDLKSFRERVQVTRWHAQRVVGFSLAGHAVPKMVLAAPRQPFGACSHNPELVVMSLMSVGFAAGSAGPLLATVMAAVSIDLDKSVLLQMVIFAVLIVVLKPLLFDPVLSVFALREERTEGARQTARELQLKAGELLTRYEHELDRINRMAAEERDKARVETARLEAEILEEARQVTQRVEAEGRERIQREVAQLKAELEARSEVMAREIASKVLGREVAP